MAACAICWWAVDGDADLAPATAVVLIAAVVVAAVVVWRSSR